MRLKGKSAIITGGASGIGEYTVRDMVKEGANVLIADINDEMGEKLAAELNTEQTNVIYQHVDVSNEQDIEAMVNRAVNEFGKLDIIFSNAGIGAMSPTTDLPYEEWKKVISINLDGVFLCAKHAIKAMQQSGGGSVINCASILGHVGQAATASYTAAKGGVVNLTRALAVEYAKENIRVNAVCPGYIETPLLNELDEAMKNHLISLHPMGRLGKPEEIAKAVTFLASEDASFVTGANLLVDGGYTAQ
ncbi:SDR family NAD(P)-dependent oxidoreductase [Pseudalkalibacillus caeni]|uniref:Glucose 1-dehydrogenase n=1 Tax=Exobacillus caeni TaxID=2574798 RepID=A0A5R9F5W1_9BACL|nr:glucose 1-dehydrogenase [Pseudalkalibacillus caeni]TLS35864.1 glucose 1-dehydrogenase [Pseudalkalibacillus caeni]